VTAVKPRAALEILKSQLTPVCTIPSHYIADVLRIYICSISCRAVSTCDSCQSTSSFLAELKILSQLTPVYIVQSDYIAEFLRISSCSTSCRVWSTCDSRQTTRSSRNSQKSAHAYMYKINHYIADFSRISSCSTSCRAWSTCDSRQNMSSFLAQWARAGR